MPSTQSAEYSHRIEADVVVTGAGLAGHRAAFEALGAGAEVVVLENYSRSWRQGPHQRVRTDSVRYNA